MLSVQPSWGNAQRWQTTLFAHLFPGSVFTPVFPFTSQPPPLLFNTQAILLGGHLAWQPTPRL